MKVKELIDSLSGEDQEAEVHVAYNYGDHWNTLVAPKVQYAEAVEIRWSDYHRMPRVVEDDEEEPNNDNKRAVVLFVSRR